MTKIIESNADYPQRQRVLLNTLKYLPMAFRNEGEPKQKQNEVILSSIASTNNIDRKRELTPESGLHNIYSMPYQACRVAIPGRTPMLEAVSVSPEGWHRLALTRYNVNNVLEVSR